MRKEVLNKIGGISEDKNLVASEDFNTWLRIAEITDEFKYIKKKLGFYLVHENSAQKRDLSIPQTRYRIYANIKHKQKLDLEVKLKYMSGSYNALNNNYTKAKKDFIFVLKHGINLKFRSLLKTIIIIFKKMKKQNNFTDIIAILLKKNINEKMMKNFFFIKGRSNIYDHFL